MRVFNMILGLIIGLGLLGLVISKYMFDPITRFSSFLILTKTVALVPTRWRGNPVKTHRRLVDPKGRQRVPKTFPRQRVGTRKRSFPQHQSLGRWGKKGLELLLNQPDSEDENRQKRQATLPELAQIRPFIEDLAKTTDGVGQVMKWLKNHGLEQNTSEQCQQLLERLPDETQVKPGLTTGLDRHILIQKRISSYPLPISSDVIESWFGRFKHLLERSPQADMNRRVLLIPTLCGT